MREEFFIDGYPFKEWGFRNGHHTNYSKLRQYLVEHFGVCYWCLKPVKIYKEVCGNNAPWDNATVDHLESRFLRKKGDKVLKVLACRRCNEKRGKQDEKNYLKSHPN